MSSNYNNLMDMNAPGSGNTGSGNAGSGNAGSGNAGSSNTGSNDNLIISANKLKEILNNITDTANSNKNQLSSIIYTIMDALNYSIVGGLQGLKVELENILKDQKEKGQEESNEGMEFIGEAANFISFFLEYVRINKGLKLSDKKSPGEAPSNPANNTENQKRIEYLNNAFKHLAFTYGQLSGRTIYYISKLLRSGGVKSVGFFDPISFGSMGNSIVRMTPVGSMIGKVFDSISDFCSALVDASKSSFQSLEEERKLAGEYMEYINTELSAELAQKKYSGGATGLGDAVETRNFDKLHRGKKTKNYDVIGDFDNRINALINKKGSHSNYGVHKLTEKDILSRIDQIEEALVEFNHVSNLIKLFEKILQNNVSDSIYVKKESGTDKDTEILPLLTNPEVQLIRRTDDIRKMLDRLIMNFNAFEIDSSTNIPSSIKESNFELYKIVKDFIEKNVKDYGELVGLEKFENLASRIGLEADAITKLMEEDEEEDDDEDEKKVQNATKMIENTMKQLGNTIDKLDKITKDEEDRILKLKRASTISATQTPYTYLNNEHKAMKEKLSSLNKSKFDDIKMSVGMSGYKKYKSFFLQFKRDMQREIKSAIKLLNNSDTGGIVDDQKKNDLLIIALKKITTFIKVREFGTINNLGGKVKGKMLKKYADYKEKQKKEKETMSGGRLRANSTIRRRIKKATVRIQQTLDKFNNTRRIKGGKKYRKSRKVYSV